MSNTTEYLDFFYSAPDGLRLHARIYGAEHRRNALPAICLPGLTRNVRDFHELAIFLSSHEQSPRMVVSFDYRGRGESGYDANRHNYNVLVETGDIIAGLAALNVEHAGFIGTSRGGLIIHMLAAMRPGALKSVVFNDIGPVVEGEGLAQIRTYLERSPRPKDWAEAVQIQKMVHGESFTTLSDDDWERLARAIYVEKNGRIVADFDPKLAKAISDIDLSQPLPQLWPQFLGLTRIPLLLFRGENSKLLTAETVDQMQSLHPRMKAVTVKGQGHAPMLETADLPERIAKFLATTDH